MARYIGATLNLKNGNFFTNMKSAVSAAGGLKGALGNTTTAMSKHGQQASATGTALKDLAKRAVGVVAAYASFSAVKNFMTDCVSLANEQAAAEQRLQTTMSNVAGTTQSQISSIKSYAAELQSLTTIGDEVAITGASQLATFQLQSDTIKTLMPAMEDLAVAQYGVTVSSDQMQSMANLVGKVMTGNVSALSRYGVVMDETQKKILQTGTESQKAAVLVDVLGQNFGGLAEAMANTPEGRIQQLKNAWGDMKEVIGAQLYPAITAILTYMTDKIPAVQSVLSGIMSGLQPIIGWAADIAIPTIGNAIGFVVQTVQGIYTACQPALSGLQDAFGRLGGAISGVFSGDGVSLIGSLAQTIFPVFINTVSGAANIVAGLVGIFGKLAPVILGVASAVGVYNAAVKIQNMLDTIRQGATKLLSAAGVANTATLTAMTGAEFAHTAAASAGSVATWALNSALAVLTSPITLVIAAIAALAAIFVVLWKKCDGFRNFFIGLWDKIKSSVSAAWDYIKKSLEPLVNAIKGAFQAAWDAIKAVWGFVQPFFQAKINSIKAIFSVVKTYIGGAFKTALAIVKAAWDTVIGYFTAIWNTIKGVFSAVKAVFSGDFQGAWDAIKGIFATWGEFFSGLWNNVVNVFSTVGTWFSSVFSAAWTAVTGIFATWGEFFSGLWNGIVGVFSGVGTWFSEQFTSAVNNIKNVFSTLGSFFSGIWETIKTTFSALGTKIGDAIGNAVKAGINGVLTAIENVINKGIGLINGAIDLINKVIPGGNPVGHINTLKFPRLATGGIVSQPTFAQIGEAGSEAVLPLDSFWNKLERIMTSREYAYAGNGGNVTNHVYVTVEGGNTADETLGDRIARKIVDALENM